MKKGMEERLELVKIIEQDQENWKRLIDICFSNCQ